MTFLTPSTQTTPSITYLEGTLKIEGNAIPFEPELFWPVNIHQIKKLPISNIEIDLKYLNSTSIHYILQILNINNISITWICNEDDDMVELGEMLEDLSNNKFNYLILEAF